MNAENQAVRDWAIKWTKGVIQGAARGGTKPESAVKAIRTMGATEPTATQSARAMLEEVERETMQLLGPFAGDRSQRLARLARLKELL
jgi:hypothetical protein